MNPHDAAVLKWLVAEHSWWRQQHEIHHINDVVYWIKNDES